MAAIRAISDDIPDPPDDTMLGLGPPAQPSSATSETSAIVKIVSHFSPVTSELIRRGILS